MKKIVVQVRMDQELKDQSTQVLSNLGLDMSTAVRLFLQQTVIQKGLPFGMMGLDGVGEDCVQTVTQVGAVSEGKLYELTKTENTCRVAKEISLE